MDSVGRIVPSYVVLGRLVFVEFIGHESIWHASGFETCVLRDVKYYKHEALDQTNWAMLCKMRCVESFNLHMHVLRVFTAMMSITSRGSGSIHKSHEDSRAAGITNITVQLAAHRR